MFLNEKLVERVTREALDQLYVSDLDGTLLSSVGPMSDYSYRELTRLLESGLPFTVASARSTGSMRHLLDGLPISLPVIEHNGAMLSEFPGGQHLMWIPIKTDIARAMVEYGKSLDVHPFISTYDGETDRLYYGPLTNEGMVWLYQDRETVRDPRLREAPPVVAEMEGCFISMTFIGEEQTILQVRDWILKNFPGQIIPEFYENSYHSGWFWLTNHSSSATKAKALTTLCDLLRVPLPEVTVFGDQRNDISMFREAGRAVAVAGAIDELRQHADLVIGSNDDDSVVRFLQQDWQPYPLNSAEVKIPESD